jgi:uncharacterized membrane protein YhaH (DUF805 family)
MPLIFQPLAKYADFSGRARRAEFWLWHLFTAGVGFLLFLAIGATSDGRTDVNGSAGMFALLYLAFVAATFIPSLAVLFRRLHDSDKSAVWILILLIPFMGLMVIFIFTLLDGTFGPNRYGPDPKKRTPVQGGVTEVHHYHHHGNASGAPSAEPDAAS